MGILQGFASIGLVATFLYGTSSPSMAADSSDFFKGKTITMAVGFAVGSGIDAYSRLLARHMVDNIPGKPVMIVSNVLGAGSQTAVQSLETSPKDGTHIVAFNPGNITLSLIDPENMKYRFTELGYLGSIGAESQICGMWHTTGIKTFDDFIKRPQVSIGATAPGTSAYMLGAMVRNLFGAKIKHVLGYSGRAEQFLAIERGELDGDCGSADSFPKEWAPNNKINVVVRFTKGEPKGMPSSPYIMDFANDEQKQIMNVVLAINEMFHPYVVAKEVPQDRLEILRDAFMKTITGKPFLEEAQKAQRTVEGQMSGADVAKLVVDIYKTSPAITKKAKDAIN